MTDSHYTDDHIVCERFEFTDREAQKLGDAGMARLIRKTEQRVRRLAKKLGWKRINVTHVYDADYPTLGYPMFLLGPNSHYPQPQTWKQALVYASFGDGVLAFYECVIMDVDWYDDYDRSNNRALAKWDKVETLS